MVSSALLVPIATACCMLIITSSCCIEAFTIPVKKHLQHNKKQFSLQVPLLLLHQSINDTNNNNNNNVNIEKTYDMPWSTQQEWAIQDKISQYTINIPRLNNPTLKGGGINKTTFALWYTMREEVTEIMGYEIDYLQSKHAALLEEENPPGVLPYIDDFEFRNNGGIKGRVYGLVGIEPGTDIVTSPLKDVELTLPKGFVLTGDESCAYELGIPKSGKKSMNININGKDMNPYSMDLSALAEDGTDLISNVGEESERFAGNVMKQLGDPETSQMIVNLGATTAVVLGAATAMNMLTHHLTVNVFWV